MQSITKSTPLASSVDGGQLEETHLKDEQQPITAGLCGCEEEGMWDDFVLSHPNGSPFHLTAWKKSIEETYHYQPVYIVAREGKTIRGVLPLFLVRNFLVKRALISSPFAVYGGVLADCEGARSAIKERLISLARELRVQYVELRNIVPEQCLGFERVSRYVTFTQELRGEEPAILESIPRKTRRMVRKSLENDYSVHQTTGWSESFFELYTRNLRRLGTPAFSRKHFARLLANFQSMVDIREIALNGRPAAAVLSFYFSDQVLPYYGASDPAAHAASPNNFMYFDLMRWAAQNGYRTFDFGRSRKQASGSYDFKAHWGMVERELPYEFLLVRRKELPQYNPGNSRFGFFLKMWQRLPLPVTRMLGPSVVRLFP